MAFRFFRRKRIGKKTHLNVSNKGVSVSRKFGPISVSSRGRGSIRLGKGKSWRF